ncbi:hypothetical protein [Actinoplanes regularis]|uniref:hypothetical protein n=1 Tax=Actinoplanes regularis TaxID=52697 RepID=UPI0024A0418A|nr:hypothetical protein [Actinoplanes regularis]GLW30388.1 hypothetical protein Areg01_33280 [Actinoplanes regularis]
MRLRTLFRRLLLPPVAAGLVVSSLALPARAESLTDFPLLFIDIADTVTVIDGQSKTVNFDIRNFGGGNAENVAVGFGPVPAEIGFVPPAGCSVTTCELDKLAPGEKHRFSFTVKPTAAAIPDLAMKLDVSVSIDGEENDSTAVQVVRTTKSGADLELAEIKDMNLGRGQSTDLPVTISNTGNTASTTLGLAVFAEEGIEPDLDYRNCEKDDEGGVICVIDERLAPGETAGLAVQSPAKLKVGADVPGPASYFVDVVAVGLSDKFVAEFAKRNAGRTGTELQLKKTAKVAQLNADDEDPISDDLNPRDNVAEFTVSVPKSDADSKAIGGTIRGTVGDHVTFQVGTQNLGPTATIPLNFTAIRYVHVNLPVGVELTEETESCLPGTSLDDIDFEGTLASRDWVCLAAQQLPKGKKSMFTFTAEIQDGSHEAGFVQVDGGVQDSNHGNDKAALTVEAQEGLPVTGPSAVLLAGAGAALLVVGVFAFRLARRRRIITIVE